MSKARVVRLPAEFVEFVPVGHMERLLWPVVAAMGDSEAQFVWGCSNSDADFEERVCRWRDSGKLKVFAAGGLGTLSVGSVSHGVLRRDDFTRLVREDFNMEVIVADLLAADLVNPLPHFVSSARPLEVPAALLALPDDAEIYYEEKFGGVSGNGICSAAVYRKLIRSTMARQAEGHFTLNEAAQVLTDSRPDLDPMETVKRFRMAHSNRKLRIHQSGSRFPLEVGETVRDFCDTVEVGELDAWLRDLAGYGFPNESRVEATAAAVPDSDTRQDERLRAYRAAGYEPPKPKKRWLGVGAVAKTLGIKRQTLTSDLIAAWTREGDRARAGAALPR